MAFWKFKKFRGRRFAYWIEKDYSRVISQKYIRKNTPLLIEGGAGSGKSTQLKRFCEFLIKEGYHVIMWDCNEPLSRLLPPAERRGEDITERFNKLLGSISSNGAKTALILDDAEVLKGRKLEYAVKLMQQAKWILVGANNMNHLSPKLRYRLKNARILSLHNPEPIDITWVFMVALGLGLLIIVGWQALIPIFMLRYLFLQSKEIYRH